MLQAGRLTGETSGEITARRPPLAHANTRMAHVAGKIKQFVMARVAEAPNGFLLKALALGAGALVVAVGGYGVLKSIANSERLTAVEARQDFADELRPILERIDRSLRELERE